jgi:hypothetical protein
MQYTNKIKSIHPAYIAGLWEADGHADRKHQKYIAITFHEKDMPLVHQIQADLGGTIRVKAKEHALVLTIRKEQAIQDFFKTIHGKLRTPKHDDLQKFPFDIGNRDMSSLLSNAWLAGFFDGDSGFKVRYTHEKRCPETDKVQTKHRIALSLVIEQRQTHKLTGESFKPIMQKIADCFDVPLKVRFHATKPYYCVEVSSFWKLKKIIDYLDDFPLFSSKALDFHDWKRVWEMIHLKEHLTPEGKARILSLKHGMNRGRII